MALRRNGSVRQGPPAVRCGAAALRAVHRAEPMPGTLTGMVEERYGIGLLRAGHTQAARLMLEAAYAHLEKSIGNDGLTAEALTYLG